MVFVYCSGIGTNGIIGCASCQSSAVLTVDQPGGRWGFLCSFSCCSGVSLLVRLSVGQWEELRRRFIMFSHQIIIVSHVVRRGHVSRCRNILMRTPPSSRPPVSPGCFLRVSMSCVSLLWWGMCTMSPWQANQLWWEVHVHSVAMFAYFYRMPVQ